MSNDRFTVQDALEEYLSAAGYDGMFCPLESCSCVVGNLAPCNVLEPLECMPGHKLVCKCEEEHEFHIGVQV